MSQGHLAQDAKDDRRRIAALHMAVSHDSQAIADWLRSETQHAAPVSRRTDHDGALHCL